MTHKNFFEKYQILIGIVIVGLIFIFANRGQIESKPIPKVDTVFIDNKATIDSMQNVIDLLNEEMAQTTRMSVREQQAAAAVYQIQHYIDITEKRPQNKVFFFGWAKRAIKDFIEYDKELNK